MKSLAQFITEAMIGVDNYEIICKEFANKINALSKDVMVEIRDSAGGPEMWIGSKLTKDQLKEYETSFKYHHESMFMDACKVLRIPYTKLYKDTGGSNIMLDYLVTNKGYTGASILMYSDEEYDDKYGKKMVDTAFCVQLASCVYALFGVMYQMGVNNDESDKTYVANEKEAKVICHDFIFAVKDTKEKRVRR